MREIAVVAAVIVDPAGRLFAARRGPGMRHPGCWELPGGKIEPGESPQAALRREIHEELAAWITVHEHLATNRHVYTDRTVVLAAYRCTVQSGVLTPSEHDAVQWLSLDDLHRVNWAAADVPLLAAAAPFMMR